MIDPEVAMRMLQVPVRDMAPIQGTVPESALKAAVQHRQTDITLQAQSRLQEIRRFIFSGFQKGCYNLAKFDSEVLPPEFKGLQK